MKGSTLKYLASVADMARLDLEAAAVTLRSENGELSAGYAGAYARGVRRAQSDTPDFSMSVAATRFKALAMMFSDEESVILREDTRQPGLVIRSKTSDAQLRRWGEETDYPEMDKDDSELAARLPAVSLIAEIEAASDFRAESMLRPALTGIRLDFIPGEGLTVTAFDGFGALFQSKVKARIKGSGSITVPATDFLSGAKLVADGDAVIVKPKSEAVIIYNGQALFRSSLIATEWPDVSKVMAQRNRTHFKVDASQIRNLVIGAKALESGPDVEVRPKDNGYVLFSVAGEAGGFTTAVKGKITQPLRYDADILNKAVRLGPVLDFFVPERAQEPTVIQSDHRTCWITTRI